MSEQLVDRFIEALGRLEAERDVETMAALYAEGAEVGNVTAAGEHEGPGGARDFWTKYRDTFGEVRSTFRNRVEGERAAALEWTSEGTTSGGESFSYEGVSVIEHDGQKITRFRAYFNPEALGRQVERAAAGGQ
ncbi:MAG TPA: nuclear transport factor 2 family protein [Pyrinomonadaceae bacterium]|nr:nuclear transport factor 2 family protein [Pyrinomonadaceae bacterium]